MDEFGPAACTITHAKRVSERLRKPVRTFVADPKIGASRRLAQNPLLNISDPEKNNSQRRFPPSSTQPLSTTTSTQVVAMFSRAVRRAAVPLCTRPSIPLAAVARRTVTTNAASAGLGSPVPKVSPARLLLADGCHVLHSSWCPAAGLYSHA